MNYFKDIESIRIEDLWQYFMCYHHLFPSLGTDKSHLVNFNEYFMTLLWVTCKLLLLALMETLPVKVHYNYFIPAIKTIRIHFHKDQTKLIQLFEVTIYNYILRKFDGHGQLTDSRRSLFAVFGFNFWSAYHVLHCQIVALLFSCSLFQEAICQCPWLKVNLAHDLLSVYRYKRSPCPTLGLSMDIWKRINPCVYKDDRNNPLQKSNLF